MRACKINSGMTGAGSFAQVSAKWCADGYGYEREIGTGSWFFEK